MDVILLEQQIHFYLETPDSQTLNADPVLIAGDVLRNMFPRPLLEGLYLEEVPKYHNRCLWEKITW